MRRPLSFALIGLLSYSACVLAAEPVAGPQISLSAQARQTVANDQALAVLYAEASSANPQRVVDELNRQGQRALDIAKGYKQVRIASGNRSTWPVYDPNDKEHRNQPTGWRGRAEWRLESLDSQALARLVAALQPGLRLASLGFQPSGPTRQKAENALIPAAMTAFEERARLSAQALGYSKGRIVEITLNGGGMPMPVQNLRFAQTASMADSMPIAEGESELSLQASGRIELLPSR